VSYFSPFYFLKNIMATTNWNLDASHSEVTFKVKHLVISTVSGQFKEFSATATTEGNDFSTAKINFDINAASLDTGKEMRDGHLRGNDFFNSESFPTIQFASTAVRKTGGDQYEIDGQLTIRDVTKAITLQTEMGGIAVDLYGQTKAGFEVSGKIKRQEFGLTWNALTEAGGAVVSDEVKFMANVQFIKG